MLLPTNFNGKLSTWMALKSAHPAEFRQIEAGNGTDPFLCVGGGGRDTKSALSVPH